MKTFIALLITGMIVIGSSSCIQSRPVARETPHNNEGYRVDYLFEHDGCKVYRFYDRGNYVYFTNCSGDVTSISNDSVSTRVQAVTKNILSTK